MPDVRTLLAQMEEENILGDMANDIRLSFGPPSQPFLGATLLPDRVVRSNRYTERSLKFMTVIANDGARHAPAQVKGSGVVAADIGVVLGDQDIKRVFDSNDYEDLLAILRTQPTMDQAMNTVLRWVDRALIRPLEQIKEKHRWDAIVDAQIVRRGHNKYVQTVSYEDPDDHRVTLGTPWTDENADPFDDIETQAQLLRDKGFQPTRIVTSAAVVSVMSKNPNVKSRTGQAVLRVDGSGALLAPQYLNATLSSINATLLGMGLPVIEVYDATYKTQRETAFYLKRKTMVILSTTEFDETLFIPTDTPGVDEPRFMENTIGYTAVGTPVGYSDPGRVVFLNPHLTTKPPRIEGEAWQATIPVIKEPESIATIEGIYA